MTTRPGNLCLLQVQSCVLTAALGGSLTVSCRYAHTYRDHTKYWCKGKTYELCHIVVKTPRNRPSSRAFIEDYKQKGFFTVTMTSLEERDEDQYWCVISTSWRNVHTGVRVRISHPSGEIPTHSESCVGERSEVTSPLLQHPREVAPVKLATVTT
uniref:Ig-like domain-containing protein n=1 Tax=Takifugu rubripes TaxID=31033 RepID=A0A3B5K7V8_TAKRU